MWRLTPIEAKQPARELQGIVSNLSLVANGVPNFLKLLAKSPASMKAYVQAEEALANGQLTPRQREEISIAVAEINGSSYCRATHELAAKRAGLSDEQIQFARKASSTDPKTEAMLYFVQTVALQRGDVNDDDFSAVRKAGFSEVEVIEILANVVLNIFTNYFNILAQTDLDSPPSPANREAPLAERGASANSRRKQTSSQHLSQP